MLGLLIGIVLNTFVMSCKNKKKSKKSKNAEGDADGEEEWESDESSSEEEGLYGALLKRNAAPKKMTD